jgi:hypothetical protein
MVAAAEAPPKKPKGEKKPKEPKKPKAPKVELVKVDRLEYEHSLKCQSLAKEIKADEIEVQQLKEEYTAARNSLKEKSARLTRMTFSGPERHPLFDAKPTAQANDGPKDGTDTPAKPTQEQDSAWRNVDIGTVLADPSFDKLVERLKENGIQTAGDFEDLRADQKRSPNGAWHKSIQGIGQAKADRVENAFLDWIAKAR